jgi:hypothetical protein
LLLRPLAATTYTSRKAAKAGAPAGRGLVARLRNFGKLWKYDDVQQGVAISGPREALSSAPDGAGSSAFALAGAGGALKSRKVSCGAPPESASSPVEVVPGAAEFCNLVDALHGMHAKGWVHRDPRPANFFRTEDGSFVLSDLGAARRAGVALDTADERPWAFTYGPLTALRKLRDGDVQLSHTFADDFEQVRGLPFAQGRSFLTILRA